MDFVKNQGCVLLFLLPHLVILFTTQNTLGVNPMTGILLPKLSPTVRKNCSADREKCLRSLKQFIQAVKGQNNF